MNCQRLFFGEKSKIPYAAVVTGAPVRVKMDLINYARLQSMYTMKTFMILNWSGPTLSALTRMYV